MLSTIKVFVYLLGLRTLRYPYMLVLNSKKRVSDSEKLDIIKQRMNLFKKHGFYDEFKNYDCIRKIDNLYWEVEKKCMAKIFEKQFKEMEELIKNLENRE